MKNIQKLSQNSSRLLSSSNIITSVFSVVKELVENSLDGGATIIEVKLENSGLDRIEVRDNGCGIEKCDVVNVAKAHFTSKISSHLELDQLETYGFRGEALSALCAMATLAITTKTVNDDISTTYTFDKTGDISSSKPSPSPCGTIVIAENLFKDMPVRKKYYKSDKCKKEEIKKIEDLLCAFSCAQIGTRFALYHNKSLVWQKSSAADMKAVLIQVFGNSIVTQMEQNYFECAEEELKIEAFLPKKAAPVLCVTRTQNDRCIVIINKRPVNLKAINKLIQETYCQSIGHDEVKNRFPICLISLTVPSSKLDVNVDPNKTQVLLHNFENISAILSVFLLKSFSGEEKRPGNSTVKAVSDNCLNKQQVNAKSQLLLNGTVNFPMNEHVKNKIGVSTNEKPSKTHHNSGPTLYLNKKSDHVQPENVNGTDDIQSIKNTPQLTKTNSVSALTYNLVDEVTSKPKTIVQMPHVDLGNINCSSSLHISTIPDRNQTSSDHVERYGITSSRIRRNSEGSVNIPRNNNTKNTIDLNDIQEVQYLSTNLAESNNYSSHIPMQTGGLFPQTIISESSFKNHEKQQVSCFSGTGTEPLQYKEFHQSKGYHSVADTQKRSIPDLSCEKIQLTLANPLKNPCNRPSFLSCSNLEAVNSVSSSKQPPMKSIPEQSAHMDIETHIKQSTLEKSGGVNSATIIESDPEVLQILPSSKELISSAVSSSIFNEGLPNQLSRKDSDHIGTADHNSTESMPSNNVTRLRIDSPSSKNNLQKDTMDVDWPLGKMFDDSGKPMQPVVVCTSNPAKRNLSDTNNAPEGNKKQKTSPSNKKAEDNLMKKPMTGFEYFCFSRRFEVKATYPEYNNQEIAKVLYEQWKNLPPEKKLIFKESAVKQYRKNVKPKKQLSNTLNQALSKSKKHNEKSNNATNSESTHRKKKENIMKFCIQDLKNMFSSSLEKENNDDEDEDPKGATYTPIKVLSAGVWLCSVADDLVLLNSYRIKEMLIYHRLLTTYHLEPDPLEKPIDLGSESTMDPKCWQTLMALYSGSTSSITHNSITENGFDIRVTKDNFQMVVKVTGIATCVPSYGIHDLQEILHILKERGSSLPLSEYRPAKVKHYLQSEAVRISRQSLTIQRNQELMDLLKQSQNYLPDKIMECFHGKPFCHRIFNISELK